MRFLFTMLAFFCVSALAQTPLQPPTRSSLHALTTDAPVFLPVNDAFSPLITAKDNATLTIDWKIAPGYYLYKPQFVFSSTSLTLGEAVYPQGKITNDPYIGKTEIFDAPFSMYINAGNITSNSELTITFQGCAEAGFCYPPETITAAINTNNASANNYSANKTSPEAANNNAAWYFMLALFGGVLLNLMPCVFPVLSIKVLSFIKHSQTPHHLKMHGWAYTGGVVMSFVVIAALLIYLRAGGKALGWGFQLQNPVFVAGMAGLFIVMALVLFGFIHMNFLNHFSSRAHRLTQGHHLKASFFTGALSVLVATPCTVPLMAPAVGFAFTQSAPLALGIFIALGIGLALPFLILTHCPACIAHLPKPGSWMTHLKQLLAFALLLSAVWLIWVLGNQLNIPYIATVALCLVMLAFIIWLWHLQYRLWAVLVVMAAFAVTLLPVHSSYSPFSQARLTQLRSQGEPIFINMTASWCITCLANEKTALSSGAFKTALKNNGIHYLKGDWTNQNPEITAFLKTFNRFGVPLYVFYPRGSASEPVVLPQILTPNTVTEVLNHQD